MKYEKKLNPSFVWLSAPHGARASQEGKAARVALYPATGSKKSSSLSITLYTEVMKQLRWVVGDRVEVGFDVESRCFGVRRVPKGGHALSGLSTAKEERNKIVGQSCAAVVRVSVPEDLTKVFSDRYDLGIADITEVDGVLMLPFDPPA
jgi:hypothetical protein